MSFGSSNVIITKSKAIYSTTLKEKELLQLSEKKSLPEFILGLKALPQFAETLGNIPEQIIRRAQLEDLLKKISYRQVLKIVKFAEGKYRPFYFQKIMLLEIDYLLALFRHFIAQDEDSFKPIDDIPVFVQQHASLPFKALAEVKDFETLKTILLTTRYASVIKPFLTNAIADFPYTELEQAFYVFQYRDIFHHIQSLFSGSEKKNLMMMYQTKLDLENLSKIYRLKKFYHADPAAIKKVLFIEFSRVKMGFWDEILAIKDAEDVLTAFHSSNFSTIKDENDYVFIEFDIDKIKYNLAKRFLYFSTSAAEVFSAFTILEEIEQINLTNIIEGIRYNLDSKKIQRMLIY